MEDLFQDLGQCIKIYLSIEVQDDPYEKNKVQTYLNPIYIQGIVSDLISSQIAYKLPGIRTQKAKEIVVNKEHRTLIEKSKKIEIQENNKWVSFEGWKDNGRTQIREEGDYIRLYVYVN